MSKLRCKDMCWDDEVDECGELHVVAFSVEGEQLLDAGHWLDKEDAAKLVNHLIEVFDLKVVTAYE